MHPAVGQVGGYILRCAHEKLSTDVHFGHFPRHQLAQPVFDQLAGQFAFQLLRLFVARQQHGGFDLHQPRRHLQKLGCHIQIGFLHLADGIHILRQHLGDGNIVNIQLVFLHQKQEQIQRPFKRGQLIGDRFHKAPALKLIGHTEQSANQPARSAAQQIQRGIQHAGKQ